MWFRWAHLLVLVIRWTLTRMGCLLPDVAGHRCDVCNHSTLLIYKIYPEQTITINLLKKRDNFG